MDIKKNGETGIKYNEEWSKIKSSIKGLKKKRGARTC